MHPRLDNEGRPVDLDEVLADYMRRVDRGEPLDQEALIAAYPELAAELREYFLQAEALERFAVDDTVDYSRQLTPRGALEVRCPSCHAPMEVEADTPLTDLTCSDCGSRFSLVNQNNATWTAPPLSTLGRFDLVERLGVGAFGSVWKARDKELDRTVAIKIPRHCAMTPEEQEKFFREARAAAQLRHPNIVSVHEVGRDGDSVYIVGDLVRGVTLSDRLSGQPFTSREAAELCATVADALHHAHEQGVVHRDLKPANIMIDGAGQPHVMDFGLARRDAGEVTVTMDGQVVGTPAYMSPEQAQGESHKADRRSDVYSLGVILFQLLTGELPFRGNARMIMQQVIVDEPPSPRKFNSNVPKDLETIALKCLEKDPSRRFISAQELRAELSRFLRGEPIHARRINSIERAWRWCRRRPIAATLLALVCAIAVIGPAVAFRQALLVDERDHAIREQIQAISLKDSALDEKQQALVRERQATDVAEDRFQLAESRRLSLLADQFRDTHPQRAALLAIEALKATDEPTAAAHQALRDILPNLTGRALTQETGPAYQAEFSPSGRTLVTCHRDGTIRVWDLSNRDAPTPTVIGRIEEQVFHIAFSRNEKRMAFLADRSQAVRYCALEFRDDKVMAGKLNEIRTSGSVKLLVVSPDGKWLAGATEGQVFLADVTADNPSFRELPLASADNEVLNLAFDSPGQWLVASSGESAYLWDVSANFSTDSRRELKGHRPPIWEIAFDAESKRVATSDEAGIARIWEIVGKNLSEQPQQLNVDDKQVTSIKFDPSGRWLVTDGSSVVAWDLTGDEPRRVELISFEIGSFSSQLEFDRGGQWLSGAEDGTVYRWNLSEADPATAPMTLPIWRQKAPPSVTPRHNFFADKSDHWLAVNSIGFRENEIWLSDLRAKDPAESIFRFRAHDDAVSIRLAGQGDWLASNDAAGQVRLWDLQRLRPPAKSEGAIKEITVSALGPGARQYAIIDEWGKAEVTDLTQEPRIWKGIPGEVTVLSGIAFDPLGRWLAAGSQVGVARLYDVRSAFDPNVYIELPSHTPKDGDSAAYGINVHIGGTGRHLATSSPYYHRDIRIWDLKSEDPSKSPRLISAASNVTCLGFDPSENRVAVGDEEGAVLIWNLQAEPSIPPRELKTRHARAVTSVALGPQNWLITGFDDGSVRLWDLSGDNQKPRKVIDDDPLAGGSRSILVGAKNVQWHPGAEPGFYAPPVAVDARERWAIVGIRDRLLLIDLHDDQLVATTLLAHPQEGAWIVSSDGRWLVAFPEAEGEIKVAIWDLFTPNPAASLVLSQNAPRGIVDPTGSWLVGLQNGRVTKSPLHVSDLIQEAQRQIGRVLDDEERRRFIDETESGIRLPAGNSAFRLRFSLIAQVPQPIPGETAPVSALVLRSRAEDSRRLGDALIAIGEFFERPKALAAYDEAEKLLIDLAAANPDSLATRFGLACVHLSRGNAHLAIGNRDESVRHQQLAIQAFEDLLKEDAENLDFAQGLADSLTVLSRAVDRAEEPDKALNSLTRAVSIRRKIFDRMSAAPQHLFALWADCYNLGILCNNAGRPDDALAAYNTGLLALANLGADSPPSLAMLQERQAMLHRNIANTYLRSRDFEKSIEHSSQAIALIDLASNVNETRARNEILCNSLWARAMALDKLKRHEEADPEWDRAIGANTQGTQLLTSRVDSLGSSGRFQDASKFAERIIQESPREPYAYYQRAIGLLAAGDAAAYRRECERMLGVFRGTRDPNVASRILYTCLPVPEAVEDPAVLVDLAQLYYGRGGDDKRLLAAALFRAGRHEEAIEAFEASAGKISPRGWDCAFLAMANKQMQHDSEAAAQLAAAHREAEKNIYEWYERVETEHLIREAETVLNLSAAGLDSGIELPAESAD